MSARRLKGFQVSRAHVNTLIQQAGSDLTARARFMARNNGYAANAVGSWSGNVVGTGIKLGTPRLTATAARCMLRFSLAEPQLFAVCIPQGTRVTTGDRRLTFATDSTASILIGEVAVEVAATASVLGAAGNGLVAGQIAALVDPIAYVTRVENTAQTLGGSDMEADER